MVFSHNANKARRKLEARRRRHQKMREKCTEITKDNDLELVVPTDEQVISELASLKFFEGSAGWRTVLPVAKLSHPSWQISEKRFRTLWRRVKDGEFDGNDGRQLSKGSDDDPVATAGSSIGLPVQSFTLNDDDCPTTEHEESPVEEKFNHKKRFVPTGPRIL